MPIFRKNRNTASKVSVFYLRFLIKPISYNALVLIDIIKCELGYKTLTSDTVAT